jgi:hypothetical protein
MTNWRFLLVAAAISAFAGQALAQSEPWERLENKGASYAGTINEMQQSISFICSADGRASIVVHSPTFRVSVPNDHLYSLVIVTDRERLDLTVKSKDADMIYDASADLNARVTLDRLVDDLRNTRKIAIAIAKLGLQVDFTAEGAAKALDGIYAHC